MQFAGHENVLVVADKSGGQADGLHVVDDSIAHGLLLYPEGKYKSWALFAPIAARPIRYRGWKE